MKIESALRRVLFVGLVLGHAVASAALLDDREISIGDRADADRVRRQLIRFVWGGEQLPATGVKAVQRGVPSPVAGLENLERVDALEIEMECGQQTVTYHFIPKRTNRRLVVVHQGHLCELNACGVGNLIQHLLRERYAVLGVYMPRCRPGDCLGSCTGQHEAMFASLRPATGSPLKFFLEPIAVSLNHLAGGHRAGDFPRYTEFHMAGLSGGGWTTTVYAALDPRIRSSFPVAGTLPLYLRAGGSVGDVEQTLPTFYGLAGYLDLYLLGSLGRDRRQVQILNRQDDCCFGEAQHRGPPSYDDAVRGYEQRVQERLPHLGSGRFQVVIDDASTKHLISSNAIINVILQNLSARDTAADVRRF